MRRYGWCESPSVRCPRSVETWGTPDNVLSPWVSLHLQAETHGTTRASEFYVERGCREGYTLEDWLDAEREILSCEFPVWRDTKRWRSDPVRFPLVAVSASE